MLINIFIGIFSLSFLIILHEFGHFLLAKKLGVKVEEFGIGMPPKLFSKKIGETIYSLNLLPFGGFVRLLGENQKIKDNKSFSEKPIWKRTLIILGGVVTFWIVSWLIYSFLFLKGFPQAISDEEEKNFIDPKVRIAFVSPNSPAERANLIPGDVILEISNGNEQIPIYTPQQFREMVQKNKGREITLTIQRNKKIFEKTLIPRIEAPPEEGLVGVILMKTAIIKYPWYLAPIKGIEVTFSMTKNIFFGTISIIKSLILKEKIPGLEIAGPVRVVQIFSQISQAGANYYLSFLATISIYLAVFNLLPIPALDGGKLIFLGIEKIRGKPISLKLEEKITTFFFIILLFLMFLITLKDIKNLLF